MAAFTTSNAPRSPGFAERFARPLARCGLGLAVAAVAAAVQLLLWPYIPPSPQLLFYPAVVVAAQLGGFAGGATTTIASALLIAYFFLPPTGFSIESPKQALDLALFVVMAIVITVSVSRLRSARRAAWLERDRANAAMVEARHATAVKDEVLAVVAHDLKNPLQTIAMSASLIKPGDGHGAELEAHTKRIRRAAERASRFVEDLLDAAAVDAGTFHIDPQWTPLPSLIADAVATIEPLASLRDVRLVVTPVPDSFVFCDPERMEQALGNVIGNAVRYARVGSEVRIDVELSESEVRFSVRDNGPGMTEEQVAHAFERFWRGRHGPGGAGLGLFIARGVIEAHCGRIEIASEPGRGAAVMMDLPQPAARAGRAPGPSVPAMH